MMYDNMHPVNISCHLRKYFAYRQSSTGPLKAHNLSYIFHIKLFGFTPSCTLNYIGPMKVHEIIWEDFFFFIMGGNEAKCFERGDLPFSQKLVVDLTELDNFHRRVWLVAPEGPE